MTHPLLRERRSPAIFDPGHEISDAELDGLLTAAQWAPSRGNLQPWAFVVCRRGTAGHERLVPLLSRGNSWWVPRASVVLIGCVQTDEGAEPGPRGAWTGEYDVGQAMAHVSIEARALGLESHQFVGFDHDGARTAFGLPDDLRPLAGIAVGRSASAEQIAAAPEREQQREHRERARRPLRLF